MTPTPSATRPAPFVARWDLGPLSSGCCLGRWVLADANLFAGHYPGAPILPGTFLIEALVQAGSTLLGGGFELAEIVSARFLVPALPGDALEAELMLSEEGGAKALGATVVRGQSRIGQFKLGLRAATAREPKRLSACPEVLAGLTWGDVSKQAERGGQCIDPATIRRALPHRYPALLVDHARWVDADGNQPLLVASKAVTVNEPCYAVEGGDRDSWSYPSTLVVESFCQACGLTRASAASTEALLGSGGMDKGKVPVVARLAKVRVTGAAGPGEVLEHRVRLAVNRSEGAVFTGESVVGDRIVLTVERVVAAYGAA